MEKDTIGCIDIGFYCNKKQSKTFSIKKKEKVAENENKNEVDSNRARSFTLQLPLDFVPHPKAIKAKKSPTPMLLNLSPKPLPSLRNSSSKGSKENLYLSFEEVPSDIDSDDFNEDTLPSSFVSDIGISTFRKELSHMKSKYNTDNNKFKDSEDIACQRMSLTCIDKEDIIPLCRRLSLQNNKEINNQKGYSILNILELSQ